MMRVCKTKLSEETRCMERLRLAVLLPVTESDSCECACGV